jgi:glutamine amidotransferase/cyclase
VSIGGDAVEAAEEYMRNGNAPTGNSCIEQISRVYGAQAVVISVDPRRVWVSDPSETTHTTVKSATKRGPNGEEHCWWQCTIKVGIYKRKPD